MIRAACGWMLLVSMSVAQSNVVRLTDNGAWCWYQDERAVIDTAHPDGPRLLFSTVSFSSKGDPEHGDVDVVWYDIEAGEGGVFELHDRLQADDHDSAALFIRPDGRYLAAYTKHGSDKLLRWRISTRPHDPTAWDPEHTHENRIRVCYSNLFELDDEAGEQRRLYDFVRADGFDPNYFLSDDAGSTWRYGGKLHTGPAGNGANGQRPYLKYAAHGTDALHFVTTDGHPRDEDNSIYHGFLRNGVLHRSDGEVLGKLSTTRESEVRSPDLTTVLSTGTRFGGVEMRHAWTVDLHVDGEGRPYAAISARADDDDTDHRFLFARWTGERWRVFEVAKAGGYLYERENDYTGLMALHPQDPDTLFISTTIDPRDGRELPHYEIFHGHTGDGGASWAWTPVTKDSDADNLRPIVPHWDPDHTALLWLRGHMRTYGDWNAEVIGKFARGVSPATLALDDEDTVTRPAIAPDR